MASWYHGKILRIQHGKRIYRKRYLTDDEIIKLFTGTVEIQEKVDGKQSITRISDDKWLIEEDISGKNTVHRHVLEYKTPQKRIPLDVVEVIEDKLYFGPYTEIGWMGEMGGMGGMGGMGNKLKLATIVLEKPTLDYIYEVLESLSKLPSCFGADEIEGLVIKNYQYQLMGKWVNGKFEDKIDESEKLKSK